jgi:hypothetical protein
MKNRIMIEAVIKEERGNHYVVEDFVKMEVHDFVDHVVLKYVTKGNKFQALPARLTTDMGREEQRINEDKQIL